MTVARRLAFLNSAGVFGLYSAATKAAASALRGTYGLPCKIGEIAEDCPGATCYLAGPASRAVRSESSRSTTSWSAPRRSRCPIQEQTPIRVDGQVPAAGRANDVLAGATAS